VDLDQLIDTYVIELNRNEAYKYTQKNDISKTKIDDLICNFLHKLNENLTINSEEFKSFSEKINKLDNKIKDSIIHFIFLIAHNIYKKHENEINKAVEEIGKKQKPIHQGSPNVEKYADLINIYRLFAQNNSIYEGANLSNSFPGVYPYLHKTLSANIPFAINALMLTGNIPQEEYNGIRNGQALYPLHLKVTQNSKLHTKKGIKKSDDYYPYKSVTKIYKGDTGDNTFLATNGDKILFVRGVEQYAPNGIFASKIATLVSSTHFSSERLLDNGVVASKGIDSYACSAADQITRVSRKRYIEDSEKVFPGTGIIDEVTNYVVETDDNIENLGFSSENIDEAHLSKIDFDRCCPSTPSTRNDYENDLVSKPRGGIYHALPHVQQDKGYICEKLYARLKLSMLTEPLLRGLADKAYMENNQEYKNAAIEQCHRRSNITLELFKKHQEAKKYIIAQPEIVNQCYTEIIGYIKKHFEENAQQELLTSLQKRVEFICSQLSNQFKVKILPLKQNTGHQDIAKNATTTHDEVDHLQGVPSHVVGFNDGITEEKPTSFEDKHSLSEKKERLFIPDGLKFIANMHNLTQPFEQMRTDLSNYAKELKNRLSKNPNEAIAIAEKLKLEESVQKTYDFLDDLNGIYTGYTRVLRLAENSPVPTKINRNTLIMQKGGGSWIAYWYDGQEIHTSSLREGETDVEAISRQLPEVGGYSSNQDLINCITKSYNCTLLTPDDKIEEINKSYRKYHEFITSSPLRLSIVSSFAVLGVLAGAVIGAILGFIVGAALGGSAGSIIPGFGTVVGAGAGGAAGAAVGAVKGAGLVASILVPTGAAIGGMASGVYSGKGISALLDKLGWFQPPERKRAQFGESIKSAVIDEIKNYPKNKLGGNS
jgi:hypothetical protein